MPLAFRITPGSPVPIYQQIVDQVRHAAATGQLAPGEPLPSVRALAALLVINPNTVARAYTELVRDGLAESQAGKAVTLARQRQIYTRSERLRRLAPHLEALAREAVSLGFSPAETAELVARHVSQLGPDHARSPDHG